MRRRPADSAAELTMSQPWPDAHLVSAFAGVAASDVGDLMSPEGTDEFRRDLLDRMLRLSRGELPAAVDRLVLSECVEIRDTYGVELAESEAGRYIMACLVVHGAIEGSNGDLRDSRAVWEACVAKFPLRTLELLCACVWMVATVRTVGLTHRIHDMLSRLLAAKPRGDETSSSQ